MSNHRLHDFVKLGQQIFAGIGENPERFTGLMDEMRRANGAEIAEGDDFIIAVRKCLRGTITNAPTGVGLPGWKSWFSNQHTGCILVDGTAVVGIRPSALVNKLGPSAYGRDWLPKNTRELSGALLRTSSIFSDIGIHITKREPSKGNVYWEFSLSKEAVNALADGQ